MTEPTKKIDSVVKAAAPSTIKDEMLADIDKDLMLRLLDTLIEEQD